MHSSQLNEKYSLENMLLDLEKLHMIEDQNGKFTEVREQGSRRTY